MKTRLARHSLVDQVYDALIDDICEGKIPARAHLVQEDIAERFGVSRQPVQQAMARLKADGMVEELGRRGLWVPPLDATLMQAHYDIRAVLDGLAARRAAERARDDPRAAETFRRRIDAILKGGAEAVTAGRVAHQVRQDQALHGLIYEMSGNALLARAAEPQWRFLRRAMGEVLRRITLPTEIWRQHGEIAEAIGAGEPDRAEALMLAHVTEASETLGSALDDQDTDKTRP